MDSKMRPRRRQVGLRKPPEAPPGKTMLQTWPPRRPKGAPGGPGRAFGPFPRAPGGPGTPPGGPPRTPREAPGRPRNTFNRLINELGNRSMHRLIDGSSDRLLDSSMHRLIDVLIDRLIETWPHNFRPGGMREAIK